MSYSSQHLLFRVHGSFGSISTEELDFFSFGLRIFIGPADFTEAKKTAFLPDVAPDPLATF